MSEGLRERRLSEPGPVFQKKMPASQQTDKNILDHIRLPAQHGIQGLSQSKQERCG
jgi:hypothetical protein